MDVVANITNSKGIQKPHVDKRKAGIVVSFCKHRAQLQSFHLHEQRVVDDQAAFLSKNGEAISTSPLDSPSIGLRRLCFRRVGLCLKCLYLCLRLTLRSITFLFHPLQLGLDFCIELVNLLLELCLPVRMSFS